MLHNPHPRKLVLVAFKHNPLHPSVQPHLPLFPVRKIRIHKALEELAVLGGEEVYEFVNDHKLTEVSGEIEKFGVQRQPSPGRY